MRRAQPDDTLSYDQYDFDISDDGHQADVHTLKLALKEAMSLLPPKQKVAIYRRYFLGETQQEVAAHMRLSQQRIAQLESTALATLKATIGGTSNPAPTAHSHEVWLRSVEADRDCQPHYAQTRYR